DHVIVSPIESVKIAFEVKSNLGSTEIAKIYKEAQNLKDSSNLPDSLCPKVVGFSYTCANIKLTYYDFVNSFLSNSHYPTMVAILNIGILAFIDEHNSFSKTPDKSCTPVLLETGEDTLLVFTYLLTEFISESHVASAIRKYSNQFFTSMSYFAFEKTFLDAMKKMSAKMRVHFEGQLEIGINDTYDTLKKELGL
ncbi:hypothetical protein, partial [uncultured Mucilaginibacter sp.]|uniref:hypothetical protein n=1 Tax=uncultured Mucilaginibacter sp. TaxID=797541 RepID=UPI0025E02EBC